ncbi:MAG: hypothetical protein ACT4P6_15825 [Gemmatimonadaceae bacterium]
MSDGAPLTKAQLVDLVARRIRHQRDRPLDARHPDQTLRVRRRQYPIAQYMLEPPNLSRQQRVLFRMQGCLQPREFELYNE